MLNRNVLSTYSAGLNSQICFEAASSAAFACDIMTPAICKASIRNMNAVTSGNAYLIQRMLCLCIFIARITRTAARL